MGAGRADAERRADLGKWLRREETPAGSAARRFAEAGGSLAELETGDWIFHEKRAGQFRGRVKERFSAKRCAFFALLWIEACFGGGGAGISARLRAAALLCSARDAAGGDFIQTDFCGEVGGVSVDLVFRIAAIGLIVSLLAQVLNKAGREEIATLMTLSGVVIVLLMVADLIGSFFTSMRSIFMIY